MHLDLDAFFCAVEENHNPALRGRPFAVGGQPNQRGVVASCSYPARRFGVRSAMPMAQALRRCPQLVVVPTQRKLYQQASQAVMDYLRQMTPFVEQLSIDEAFLDVSDLSDSMPTIAQELQQTIDTRLNLPCSLGGAGNKLVAKIANNMGKAAANNKGFPPRAIHIVTPGQEADFLAPLPVSELWGVGPKMAEKLLKMGLITIGALADYPQIDLIQRFGKTGYALSLRAKGIDQRPIVTHRDAKSVSQETTFAQDLSDETELRRTLRQLTEQVGRRLRRADLAGNTIKLKIRWADFSTITRQTTRTRPTNLDAEILTEAQDLFAQAWQLGRPVRLLGVGVSGFETEAFQLGLWDEPPDETTRLQEAVDQLRDRFGQDSIRRGSELP